MISFICYWFFLGTPGFDSYPDVKHDTVNTIATPMINATVI